MDEDTTSPCPACDQIVDWNDCDHDEYGNKGLRCNICGEFSDWENWFAAVERE